MQQTKSNPQLRPFKLDRSRFLIPIFLAPYLLYLAFILQNDKAAVDYETFMGIGQRFLHGQPVWLQSSYYPIPYVMIFAVLSLLPRFLSMILWHVVPVAIALVITDWSPWVLLFGPLYGHMVGGQSAVFAMLGLWGYKKYMTQDNWRAGFWLGILLLKPHLAIFPLMWAGVQWLNYLRHTRRIPKQLLGFLATAIGLYVPGFFVLPDWTVQWQQRLNQYNPIILRTVAGIVPRSLLYIVDRSSLIYFILLGGAAVVLLAIMWVVKRRRITFDAFILWSTLINPLVHDYDLIQLIPLLNTRRDQIVAAVLSIPLWFVIIFAWNNDQAWYVVTFIPLGLWLFNLWRDRHTVDEAEAKPSPTTLLTLSPMLQLGQAHGSE